MTTRLFPLVALASLIIAVSSSPGICGGSSNGTVANVTVSGNYAIRHISGNETTPTSCATVQTNFATDISTSSGRAILSIAIAAQAEARSVGVYGA